MIWGRKKPPLNPELIESHAPRTIILLGIAESLSPGVQICDVVDADQIDDYLACARTKTGEDHRLEFGLTGESYHPDVRLLNAIKFLEFDHRKCTNVSGLRAKRIYSAFEIGPVMN